MKILKGTIVEVNHSRSGRWTGIATKDFDTEKDEWYPLKLNQDEPVHGLSNTWKGDNMSARRGLCTIKPL